MPKLSVPEDKETQARATVSRRREKGRRHGGAWKVAYADFVTAMMAMFIVLWMMNASDNAKRAITGYFHDPRGYTATLGAGKANSREGAVVNQDNVRNLQKVIEEALRRMPEFKKLKDHVQFSVTAEGLRIELQETEQGTFFVSGSPAPTEAGEGLLRVLAKELAAMPNPLVIEGHTDARPFRMAAPSAGYSNWELAADRANAARRLLHYYGVRPDQVVEVRGFADQRPLAGVEAGNPRNRRVSVVVQFPRV